MAEKVLTDQQIIRAREEEISRGLMRFHGRTRWDACTEETPAHLAAMHEGEPLDAMTPAHAAAAKDGMPLDELVGSDGDLELWAIRNETVRKFFTYVAQDGLHLADVLKRLFAVGAHMGIPPFSLLTLREKELIFGDSHESHRWLMKRLCIDPLRRNGAKSIKAPGQKGTVASLAASKAQQGNSNRVGGKSTARNAAKLKRSNPPKKTQ